VRGFFFVRRPLVAAFDLLQVFDLGLVGIADLVLVRLRRARAGHRLWIVALHVAHARHGFFFDAPVVLGAEASVLRRRHVRVVALLSHRELGLFGWRRRWRGLGLRQLRHDRHRLGLRLGLRLRLRLARLVRRLFLGLLLGLLGRLGLIDRLRDRLLQRVRLGHFALAERRELELHGRVRLGGRRAQQAIGKVAEHFINWKVNAKRCQQGNYEHRYAGA
jgi:hypothetical protein